MKGVLGPAMVIAALTVACGRVDYERWVRAADAGKPETHESDAAPADAAPDGAPFTTEAGPADAASPDALPDAEAAEVPADSAVTAPAGGLRAEYFAGVAFDSLQATRVDPGVAFDWAAGAPAPSVPTDNFTVRWTGTIVPADEGDYTFHVLSAGGARLWVRNTRLIDNWTDHAATEDRGKLYLAAGRAYEIRLEFVAASRDAAVKLSWSRGAAVKEVIPADRLSPPPRPVRTYEAETDLDHGTGRPEAMGWAASPGTDAAAHMIYGPYANDWPAAWVEVTFRVMVDPAFKGADDLPLYIDVYDKSIDRVLVDRSVARSEFGLSRVYTDLPLRVNLVARAGHVLEARVWWYGLAAVNVDKVTVAPVPP